MTTSTIDTVGFIGLGVMGEPMCSHLAAKGGRVVVAYDIDAAPLARLAKGGAVAAASVAEVAERADLILLSLPGANELEAVAAGPGGLLSHCRAGAIVVDTSTSPGGAEPRVGRTLRRARRRLRRRAGGPRPRRGATRHPQHHGRGQSAGVGPHPALSRMLRNRRHPLRRCRTPARWSS